MKSYCIPLLLCGEQTRPDLVPKLVLSFEYGVHPARQNHFSQHLESSTTVLLVSWHLCYIPHSQDTNNFPASLWRVIVKKRFALLYPRFQLGSGKLKSDWSAEVFRNYSSRLKVNFAVNYTLDLAVSSAPLNFGLQIEPHRNQRSFWCIQILSAGL